MKFETYVASRFRKSYTYKNTVSSPIIKISVFSIIIGIVMMIISVSSSVGLQKTIETKISSFFGHISISNFENNTSFSSISPISLTLDYKKLHNIEPVKIKQTESLEEENKRLRKEFALVKQEREIFLCLHSL